MHALMPPVALIATLALLAWFHRNDRRNFERFRKIEDTRLRQRAFLRGAMKACALYLGMPLVGLVLLGRIDALWIFPREFWPLLPYAPVFALTDPTFLAEAAAGALGGAVLGMAILFRRRRGPRKPARALDITPMLPRNRAETLHILPLILNAGVSEEICFRLYVPLLITMCGAPAWAAFLAAAMLFGWLHRYQGWLGVVLTGVIGAALAACYVGTTGLVFPIVLHLLTNLNALILRPAIQKRFRARAD
ncbi:CPBP family intramembrane glutamic endopeptidase [Sphingomonas sp. KR3-1]|uniref:CPBP family intramembrane glutamic endopeptidase n=1 Tax=Sphingomonas sp. KR3-1 TaxID=3156611 RepID=UPI0032B381C6